MLISASLLGFFIPLKLSSLHYVIICKARMLSQLWQFSCIFYIKLANKSFYQANIGSIKFRLQEFEKTNSKTQKLRQKEPKDYQKIDKILHYQGLSFVSKAI